MVFTAEHAEAAERTRRFRETPLVFLWGVSVLDGEGALFSSRLG